MKLYLITLFFFSVQSNEFDAETFWQSRKGMWNAYIGAALHRKYGNSYNPNNPEDSCSKSCQKAPPMEAVGAFSKVEEPRSSYLDEIYNKTELTKICTYANATTACVRSCPDTQRRTFLRELFSPITYLCLNSHIVEKADCLQQAYTESKPRCFSTDCAPKIAAWSESNNAARNFQNTHRDEIRNTVTLLKPYFEAILGNSCDTVKCLVKCGDTVRTAKCGADATTEVHNFYKEVAKSLNAFRYVYSDFVFDVPELCKFGETGF